MRTEPPPSLPCATGASPAATAAAAPPLEPPAIRSRSHGVRAGGAIAVLGVAGQAELRGVGLAEQDRARIAQQRHDVVVDIRHRVGEHRAAEGRPHARGEVEVLHRHGDPVQRRAPARRAAPRRRGARACSRARSAVTVMKAPTLSDSCRCGRGSGRSARATRRLPARTAAACSRAVRSWSSAHVRQWRTASSPPNARR